jgi:hypothetical protein
MRRLTVLLACMGLMMGLVAGVAYAVVVEGTGEDERIFEPTGCENGCDDIFRMRGGDDEVFADEDPEPDRDIVRLGGGEDFADTEDGDGQDVVRGGGGVDVCDVDATDTSTCEVEN